MGRNRIILALDGMGLQESIAMMNSVGHVIYGPKIHDLADAESLARTIGSLHEAGAEQVLVDYKVDDTPKTAELRAKQIRLHGGDAMTVHVLSGPGSMIAAREHGPDRVFGITLLTTLPPDWVRKIFGREPIDVVVDLALEAAEAGLSGLVCSVEEVGILSQMDELLRMDLVVPGTRSPGKDTHEQSRTGTPGKAISDGASYLVGGREITLAEDPVAAADWINEQIIVAEKAE